MRTHIIYYLISSFFLICFSFPAAARGGNLRIHDQQFLVRNDSLIVQMDVSFRGKVTESFYALKLMPVLQSESERAELPSLIISGKKRAAFFKREQALTHGSYMEQEPVFLRVTQGGQQERQIRYESGVPYEYWMSNAELTIEHFKQDCCTDELLSVTRPEVPEVFTVPESQDLRAVTEQSGYRVNFLPIQVGETCEQSEYITLYLRYPQGVANILTDFQDNRIELTRLDDILGRLLTEGWKNLHRVVIKGCSSPEGDVQFNDHLSLQRAEGMKEYLIYRYGLPENNLFRVESAGEDWAGLLSLMNYYSVPSKKYLLDIINEYPRLDYRKQQLERIDGGKTYRELLNNLYPLLRRVELRLDYTTSELSPEAIETTWQNNPEALCREGFAYLLNKQSPETIAYFKLVITAARRFPDDLAFNLNAAAALLNRGDAVTAWRYLQRVEKNPKAYNNLGIYYLLTGDQERARSYFDKASQNHFSTQAFQ